MSAGSAYQRLWALLEDYLRPLGMLKEAGPVRAARELTFGIVFTGSVQLSNAARLFADSPAHLRHAVKRMGGHLSDPRWDHRDWAQAVLDEQARHVERDSLVPVDATELAKPYARKMEHQCLVRDGSRPDEPLVAGYWCWGAYPWRADLRSLSPLVLRPYSQERPGFLSENDEWEKGLWAVRRATGGRGIWLQDRGGDRPEVLAAFLKLHDRWVVRLREDRKLIGPDGTTRPAGAWADWALASRPERGKAVTLPVSLPPSDVKQYTLDGRPHPLWLEVPTYTYPTPRGPDRWVLLTRGLLDGRCWGPRQVRHGYGLRWRAEDAKRFLGQLWHVERFLVRSFLALERVLWCVVLWCVVLAGGFLAMLRRDEPELSDGLESEVLYWDESCTVPCYRLARGVHAAALARGHVPILNNA
jgi:hypothetical protein